MLAFAEVFRYALSHPETLLASILVGIAWWYNEDVTNKAILEAERNKVLENAPDDYYEDEGEQK